MLIDTILVVDQMLGDGDGGLERHSHHDLQLRLGKTHGGTCCHDIRQDVLHLRLHSDLVVLGDQPVLVLICDILIVGLCIGIVRLQHA